MTPFDKVFDYWPEYRVIYCRECRFCPVPDQCATHLQKHHRKIPPATRRQIVAAIQQRDDVARQPQDVIYPKPYSSPLEALAVHDDAFQCTGLDAEGQPCQEVRRDLRNIQEHCRKAHGWVNEQKSGGNVRLKQTQASNRMWKDKIRCQRFFEFATWKRYFVVGSGGVSWNKTDGFSRRAERLLDRRLQAMAESHKTQRVQASDNRYEANPWLNRTGWVPHLAKYRRDQLVELVEHPQRVDVDGQAADEDEEPNLWRACQTTVRVITKAQQACHPNVTGVHALQCVNQRECGARSNEKPFYGRQMKSSMVKYRRHITRILCWIWRTCDQEDPRPPYRLTTRQRQCLRSFQEAVDEYEGYLPTLISRDRLEGTCLKFWIALLDHQLKDHPYDSALVSGAAVLGWDAVAQKWKSATGYTSVLSGIVTVARMLVIYHARQERGQAIQRHQQEGYTEDEAYERAPSHFRLVKEMVERFMTLTKFGGEPSPLNSLLRLRTYGTKIRYSTPQDGTISWHHDEVQYGSIRFTMAELRRMVHGLVHRTRTRLRRDLLLLEVDGLGEVVKGGTALPPLDVQRLHDDHRESREGWCFLDDPRNHWAVDRTKWLFRRVTREPRLLDRFVEGGVVVRGRSAATDGRFDKSIEADEADESDDESDDEPIPFRWKEVQRFFDAATAFKRDWLVLVETTAGGPWRGSELPTVQFRNSATSTGRGVFIHSGMVQVVTGYTKGFSLSEKVKIVHRFLPPEVGEMWVYYCWLVQPLVEHFQLLRDNQQRFSPWIWEPRSQEGNQEEDDDDEWEDAEEEREAGDHGNGHNTNDGAAAASFEHADGDLEAEGWTNHVDEGNPDDAGELQSLNVDGFWNSARVTYTLQRATLAGMGVPVSILPWRHIVKAIMREYSRDRRVHEVLDDDHDVGDNGGAADGTHRGDGTHEDIRDHQFGHSSYMAGMIYGRDLMEAPGQTLSRVEGFRRVSLEWHRFLQFRSAMDTTFPVPSIRGLGGVHVGAEAEREQLRRWRMLQKVDLRGSLRLLMDNPRAEFRGRQEEVLKAIVARQSPIVAIMGTGVGKSVLFMLPAAMNPASVTVVVVPLVSLRDNMQERCEKLGIRCVAWQASCPADGAQIVLVTPEAATGEAFHNFMNRQRALGRLERIVWDESHVVLDSVDGWRPRVRQLIELSQHQTQLVYLTATLAPADEDNFFSMIGVRATEVKMFRDPTARRNIAYHTLPCVVGEEDETMIRLVEAKKRQYPMPGQIIIYCGQVKRTVKLARLLGCPAYHREVGDEQEKRRILDQLVQGKEQVFTATNALGLGIDRGSIRVVIHEGVPRRMRDFAQESGRAGRDGLASESIVVVPHRRDATGGGGGGRSQLKPGWLGPHIEPAMQLYVKGAECHRVVLDRVMDGRQDRVGCEEEQGEELCDVCRGQRRQKRRHEDRNGEVESQARQRKRKKVCRETVVRGAPNIQRVEVVEVVEATQVIEEEVVEEVIRTYQDISEIADTEDEGEGGSIEVGFISQDTTVVEVEDIDTLEKEIALDGVTATPFHAEEQQARRRCEMRRQRRRLEGVRAQELEEKLNRWYNRCAWCVIQGRENRDHSVWKCVEDGAVEIRRRSWEIIHQMRDGKHFARLSGCHSCGIPQAICRRWQVRGDGNYNRRDGGECQFQGLFHVGVMVAVIEHDRSKILTQGVVDWTREEDPTGPTEGRMMTEQQELKWLGSKMKWGSMELNRMVGQFYRCAVVLEEWEERRFNQ